MPYYTNGSITTGKRSIAESDTWETQSDWEAYQTLSNLSISSGTLSLAQIPLIDKFEDNDLTEYTVSGESGIWGTTTNAAVGDYALNASASFDGSNLISAPGDGLDTYPQRGESFRGLIRISGAYYNTGGNKIEVFFYGEGGTTKELGYALEFDLDNFDLDLIRYDSGGPATIDSVSQDFEPYNGSWLQWIIKDSSDTITAEVYDGYNSDGSLDGLSLVASVSATDNTHSGQSFGFANSNDTRGSIRFDEVVGL